MATTEELRAAAAAFLQQRFPRPEGTEGLTFSAFRPDQVEEATQLARHFGEIAARRGDEQGVADVLAAAEQEVTRRLPAIVKYALLVFLTHDPVGARVGAPSLEERHPSAVESMITTREARTQEDPASLSYFREDIFANDHHAHWHLVYRADAGRQERQGELFLYMHQQMLARYDAERLAAGRPEVEPLNLSAPGLIEDGYDPHLPGSYGARPDSVDLPEAPDLRGRQAAFDQAIEQKVFEEAYEQKRYGPSFDPSGPQPVLSLLGAVLEAEAEPLAFAGLNLHNDGHVDIAGLGRDADGSPLNGVMIDTSVAIRDVIFWRWHKLIDNEGAAWQEGQPKRDFESPDDRPPAVTIRGNGSAESQDVILVRASELGLDDMTDIAAGQAFGEEHLGDGHWDENFADKAPGTATLETHMTGRAWNGSHIEYLDLVDEFAYFIRVENPGEEPVEVTARLFMCPDEWAEDRRKWIEMDKFLHTALPGRSVIYRPSSLSSVIRKPAARPPAPSPPEDGHEPSAYCQCGWPYNLLLPRGTEAGMPFRVMAMLTDAGWDKGVDEDCGSMSFCGVRDSHYPDRRNMGYPFDRAFSGQLTNVLGGLPSVGMRTFAIKRAA
jgi:tyrosinase